MKYRIKETGIECRDIGDGLYAFDSGVHIYKSMLNKLGLTLEEVKPRKLYAYRITTPSVAVYTINGCIVNSPTTKIELFEIEQSHGGLQCTRAPEFDIEYGDK